jgi:HAD superfamily hydrolase (TIGR01509 family)
MLSALIFDVDGTLADTENAHREAFNAAFAEAGLGWRWDVPLYSLLLDIAGGKERMLHYWRSIDPARAVQPDAAAVIDQLHRLKTRHYAALLAGDGLQLRPGIARLLREARDARMPVALATTTTPANIDALLSVPLGRAWRSQFAAVCDASTSPVKKPAPDVYLAALAKLGLPPGACLAFEDSDNGLHAASAAGIPTIVTPTGFTASHRFDGALATIPHLGDPEQPLHQHIDADGRQWIDLALLRRWHAEWHTKRRQRDHPDRRLRQAR